MLFEIVVTNDREVLLDEKIEATSRDHALIRVGQRLMEEDIIHDDATSVHVRQFSPSAPIQGFTIVGALTNNTGTVTPPLTWNTAIG